MEGAPMTGQDKPVGWCVRFAVPVVLVTLLSLIGMLAAAAPIAR